MFPCLILISFLFPLDVNAFQYRNVARDTLSGKGLYAYAMTFVQQARYESADSILKKAVNLFGAGRQFDHESACYSRIAVDLALSDQFDSAGVYLEHAQRLITGMNHPDQLLYAGVISDAGAVDMARGHYREALQNFNKALGLYSNSRRDSAFLHVLIMTRKGDVLEDLGRYKESMDAYQQVLPEARDNHLSHELANIYNNAGLLYRDMGNRTKALEYYRKGYAINLALFGENHPDIANSYNNMGSLYFQDGDYARALDYFGKALRIYLKIYGPAHEEVAAAYNNIGVAYYYLDKKDIAAAYLKKALDTKIRTLGSLNYDVATGYLNIGSIYYDQKEYNRSLTYYRKSLTIKQEIEGGDNAKMILNYENISQVFEDQKKYPEALQNLNKALSLAEKYLGGHHPTTAYEHIKLGELYQIMKKYAVAVEMFQKSLISLSHGFFSMDPAQNPEVGKVQSERFLLTALHDKGKALVELYYKRHEITDLEAAISAYERAAEVVKTMRERFRSETSKLFLEEEAHKIYDDGIKASLEAFRQTGDVHYREEALNFSEWSKANVLFETVMDSKAKRFSGIPDSLIRHEQRIRDKVSHLEQKLEESSADSVHLAGIEDTLFSTRERYNRFVTRLEDDYPNYYRLKYQDPTRSAAYIQQHLLKKDEVLINYFRGDSTLYLFAVTKDRFRVYSVSAGKKLEKEITAMRLGIVQRNYGMYVQNARALYRTLIQPADSLVDGKRLMIIPDGIIGYIPFEALLTRDVSEYPSVSLPAESVYRKLPYLVINHPVSYAFSASLIDEIQNRHASREFSEQFIGLAPVFDRGKSSAVYLSGVDSGKVMTPLFSSGDEVTSIGKMFREKEGILSWFGIRDSRIFLRDKATETVLKSRLVSSSRYIHLATHAFVNEKEPDLSGIVLMPDSRKHEDGILYSGEIYNLKFNADLVTLSACETGLGKLAKGEGIIGLSRAFLYAGANNILVSLWGISDQSTSELMIRFYKNLLSGEDMAIALNKAKLSIIYDTRFAAPVYWSPFILIGSE